MFGYLEHVRYVMYVCQEGFYNPIYFCLLRACSLCNVCVSGGVLQSEITFVWGATIRIFSIFYYFGCSRKVEHGSYVDLASLEEFYTATVRSTLCYQSVYYKLSRLVLPYLMEAESV